MLSAANRTEIEEILEDIHSSEFSSIADPYSLPDGEANKYLLGLREASENASIAIDQIKTLLRRHENKIRKVAESIDLLPLDFPDQVINSFRTEATNFSAAYKEVLTLLSVEYSLLAKLYEFRMLEKGNFSVQNGNRLIFNSQSKADAFNNIARKFKLNRSNLEAAEKELREYKYGSIKNN